MFKSSKADFEKPETIIGDTVTLEMKKFESKGSVHINGKVVGEIEVGNSLVIGKLATVKGNIHTRYLLIAGEVLGNIVASEQIHIVTGGKVVGDISSKSIVLEDGGMIDGHCKVILEDVKSVKESKTK